MKKKLTMLLLALVMAFGGTSVAMLTGCDNCNPPDSGQTETEEYTVKFVDEKGNVLKETKVKSGGTVAAETLPEKAGYTAAWVDAEGKAVDFTKGITANVEYKVQYTAKTDTKYTVEHWYEGLDGEYVKDASKTEEKAAETDTTVTATAREDAHYEAASGVGEVLSGTVAGDGSLVLKVYYKLETHTVTFEADGETIDTAEVKYGGKAVPTEEAVPSKDKTESTEFRFVRWNTEDGKAYNFDAAVTGDIKLVAYYEETVRRYELDAEMYVSNLYFFAMNDEGDAWVDDDEFDAGNVAYNTEFTFKIWQDAEATGTPVVTVTKYNDDGTESVKETPTADADGYYTVIINRNTKIEVTGLTMKTYSVTVPVSMPEYEVDWAGAVDAEEIILEVIDEKGQKTYHEDVITAPVTLVKGVYRANLVREDGNGGYETLVELEAFQVNSGIADENGAITLAGDYVVGAFGVEVTSGEWTLAGGKLSSETPDITHQLSAKLTDFAPGKNDFALVVSYKQDLTKNNEESDPTFGYQFYTEDGTIFHPLLNATGMRIRGMSDKQIDARGLIDAGNMLGNSASSWDEVTEVVVRKGETFYIFLTGRRSDNASVASAENKLLAYIDAEGVHTCDGKTYADNGKIAALLENGIASANFVHQQSKNCFTTAYGWGYTYEAEVIDGYVSATQAKINITGDITESKDLKVGKNKIEIAVPEGKMIDSLTVNGTEQAFSIKDGGIYFYITVPFDGGIYDVNVTFADGSYNAVINGTVTYNGTPVVGAEVTDGKLTAFTGIDGTFTLRTSVETSYTLTVTADGYKPAVVNVTDITAGVDIELEKPMMGGTTTVGEKVYGSGLTHLVENGPTGVFKLSYDDEGNEIHTSVASSGYRNTLVFSDFAAEKFIVKGAITYNTVMDAWIRVSFAVADGNGNTGSIGFYGNGQYSSTDRDGWPNFNSVEKPPKEFNGDANAWIKAGKIEIAMIYDNAAVKFYVRCEQAWGEKWYMLYEGYMLQKDGSPKLSGPVGVAMYETQNANSSFYFSDFFISDKAEDINGVLEIADNADADVKADGNKITVTPAAGKLIKDIKVNGKSVMDEAEVQGDSYVYTMPNLWQLSGKAAVTVETADNVADAEFTGKVLLGGAPLEGASVSVINDEGTMFNAATGADGTFTVAAALGGKNATVRISGADILDKEITVEEGGALGDINVYYAFRKANAGGKEMVTGASVEVGYDKTAANSYDGLTVRQTANNQNIAWNQPIAENAAFGFTYKFGAGMSFMTGKKGEDVYLDEDVYFQHKFGDKGMSFASFGKVLDLSENGEVTDNNIFQLLEYKNMKFRWSAGIYDDVSFVFVRKGASLEVYAKASSLDRYYYVGKSTALPETGTIQFGSYNSSRGSLGVFDLTMTDIFYTENLGDVTPVLATVDNAAVAADKAAYANGENAKITVTAEEGYLVTAVTVNGVKKAVPAQATYEVELKALSPIGINVSAVETVAISALLSVKGTVTIPEKYAADYDLNGTVTYKNANAIFTGTITDGAYEIKVPAGTYDVTVTTGEFKAEETAEITAAAEGKNYTLTAFDDGFFKTVVGAGLENNNGTLKAVATGDCVDVSIGNKTFIPANQTVEFGYTLKGNLSASKYPFFGFMVKQADENRIARTIYTFGAGDQIGLILWEDWASRLGANDKPWELWKGGFVPGQKEGSSSLTAVGTYNENAWCELTFKFKVDGYKLSMWVKGTNNYMHNSGWKELNLEDWTLCFENLDVYARYNSEAKCADGNAANTKLGQLYDETQPCYFGISQRQDFTAEHVGAATYTDIWYTITDKE